jgi:hypothetical protein
MDTHFKRPIYLILIILMSSFGSCRDQMKEGKADTMQEVMAIHDEVMPEMGTISRLVGDLKPKVDSTEAGKSYDKAMKDLQESHKAMMDWMQNFGMRFEPDEIMNGRKLSAEKQQWLSEELSSVKALRDKVHMSIENARKVLSENGENGS